MEFRVQDPELWNGVLWICRRISEAGGRAHLVGGSVRDALLGLEVTDFDVEVFGLGPDALTGLLEERFELDLVGRSFGVLKVRHLPIDVSLPRRESKTGRGHRGFQVDSDPGLDPATAAARRDFTVNAISYDPVSGEVLDPYGGARDLRSGVLRHTSAKFTEDPLRVLRGMQLAARFCLEPAPETVALCRLIHPEGLPRERIFQEWRRLILHGQEISRGLAFLRATGWIVHYPELGALEGCPQDPEWHPEGDVWTHTLHVLDAFAAERCGETWEDLVVGLACLCHDLGKPATTRRQDGRIRSRGHESAGEEPTRSLLGRMSGQQRLVESVVPLVLHHLKPRQLYSEGAGDGAVRRLARKVGRIDRLVRVARADDRGRPPRPFDGFPAGTWLLERARRLHLEAHEPQPLIMGRHLVERGLAPGPHFRHYLDRCFEAQLDGRFTTLEDGLSYLDQLLAHEETSLTTGPGPAGG